MKSSSPKLNSVRFQCQECGKCCLTRDCYGHVYLSFADRKRLARHFEISVEQFTARYAKKTDGLYELKYAGRDCPFLEQAKCMVYEARPSQCRTWPFWPENMDPVVWENEVAEWCPGIGKGREYSEKEIDLILKRKKEPGAF